MLLNAPLRQESQNRWPQTDTWTAFRTGRWQIRHNKFSLTAGTKKARYPGMFLQWILFSLTRDGSWSDRLLQQNYLLLRRLHFVTELRGVFFVVWINFTCPRLTGHAQNNSVTTNVTAQGSLFAWQGYLRWTSLVYFRLRLNLSSRQIKIVCGSFHGVHFCGRSLWTAYGLFKRTLLL